VNYGIVTKVLGNLLLFETAAFALPLVVAIMHRGPDIGAFSYSILITAAVALPMSRLPRPKSDLRVKEALLIVALGWLLVSSFGSLPFLLSGSIPSAMDAFFESVSGLTTTGATIIDDIEQLPEGILFWRSFMHWLGGMGILVLALAVLPMAGVGGFHIFKAESPGPISDKLVPKLKDTAKILYTAYLGLTVIQGLLLYFGGMSVYDALLHTFGTVGTGGFSNYNDSIAAFDSSFLRMVIAVFMVAAGVNFSLYYALYQGNFRRMWRSDELKLYLLIIMTAALLITVSLQASNYGSVWERFQHAFFQASSFTTTTGYTTTDYEQWPEFAQSILFFLMFVGGSAGSTGGGIKVVRWLVAGKLIGYELRKILHPRAFVTLHVSGRAVPQETITGIVAFLFLYGMIFVVSSVVLSLLEGVPFISAASSAAATLGNIGPGFGVIGPGETYSHFTIPSKALMSLLMFLGRLELFTFFLLFTPAFWKQ